ncbi:hypothetical protein E4U13_008396 [Claviceps humidiphila]|uniref:Uncharacterized protein n=1 Tax=Claviceps humidiphila TaxID=1294629 RepID=A0A9P7Q5E7_9HYPO|nr:hypothetical protein E4U13_008396 [Claviceps humidiphila]
MIQGRASFLEIWDEVNPDHPSTFMIKQTGPQRPKVQDYQAKPDIEVPTKKSDLTKDGLRAFKEDKEEHQENIQDWKIQHNLYFTRNNERHRILQLSTLIQSTIASHLQESSCLSFAFGIIVRSNDALQIRDPIREC